MERLPKKYLPTLGFILKFSLAYLACYLLYTFYVLPYTNVDNFLIENLSSGTAWLIEAVGDESFIDENRIGIVGSSGVVIGNPCDGLELFYLFGIFVMFFPGPWKHKVWFILAGIGVIHLINILRITLLAYIVVYAPSTLEFNHSYTFTLIVYLIIFAMWMIWINRFSTGWSFNDQATHEKQQA